MVRPFRARKSAGKMARDGTDVVKERPLQDLCRVARLSSLNPFGSHVGRIEEREVKPSSCFATTSRHQGSWISAIHVPHSEPPSTRAYSPATQTFV